nr:hypothetical protein Iba_scaffold686CG0060 [Ipomoea batatas]
MEHTINRNITELRITANHIHHFHFFELSASCLFVSIPPGGSDDGIDEGSIPGINTNPLSSPIRTPGL